MSEDKAAKTEKTFEFISSNMAFQDQFKVTIEKVVAKYKDEGWIRTSNPNEVSYQGGALVAHLKFHRPIK